MADLQLEIDIQKALQGLAAFKAELKSSEAELGKLQKANKAAFDRGSVDGVVDAINELQSEYKQLQSSAATLKSALKNATDPAAIKLYSDALAKAERGMNELETAGKKAGVALKQSNKELGTGRQVAENFFGSFTKVTLITAAIAAVAKFAKYSVDLANQTEKASKQFAALTGNIDKARGIIADLQGFANRTFLPVENVNEAGKALIAFGEDSNNLIPVLNRIANISAATGKDFNELTTIYGKARVAGVLYAEDINQLVDAGIPIIQQFADQMGVSTSEVKKLASEGKIGFAELELAFASLTAAGTKFAGAAQSAGDELDRAISDAYSSAKPKLVELGEIIRNTGAALLEFARGPKEGSLLERIFGFGKGSQSAKDLRTLIEDEADDAAQFAIRMQDIELEKLEKAAIESRKKSGKKITDADKKRLEQEAKDRQRVELDIMAEGIDKDLALLNLRFDERAKAAKKYGLDTSALEEERWLAIIEVTEKYAAEQVKIETDAQKERIDNLKAQQQLIEQEKALRLQEIDIAEKQSQGFIKRLEAQGASEKEIAEAKAEFDRATQIARLNAELQFQEKLLAIADPFDQARIAQIKNSIALIQAQIDNASFDGGTKPQGFFERLKERLGLNPDEVSQLQDAAAKLADGINQIAAARLAEAEAAVEAADKKVQAAENALDKELQIAELGFNSNVDLRRKELADAEAARRQALADQQRAARAQLAIEAAQQASGIITSSVNIIKGTSDIPLVGFALGLAQVAALIAFIASVRAKSRAISSQQFREGGAGSVNADGVIVGPSHDRGGVVVPEYEGGEFFASDGSKFAVVNKRMTAKHFDLLKSINRDDRAGMAAALERLTAGPSINRDGIRESVSGTTGGKMVSINSADGFSTKERRELMHLLKTWKTQSGNSMQQVGQYTVIKNGNAVRKVKNG